MFPLFPIDNFEANIPRFPTPIVVSPWVMEDEEEYDMAMFMSAKNDFFKPSNDPDGNGSIIGGSSRNLRAALLGSQQDLLASLEKKPEDPKKKKESGLGPNTPEAGKAGGIGKDSPRGSPKPRARPQLRRT